MKLHRKQNSRSAFTLVEVAITAAVIAVLAAIAFPHYVRARETAESGTFMANVRSASGAFFTYFAAHGRFPDASLPGVVPTGMESYLEKFPWDRLSSVGGRWTWDRDVNGYRAGLAIVGATAPVAQMQTIDNRFDDGNLATGQFRSRPGGYVYVLDE